MIRLEFLGHLATVTLARPPVNAFDWRELDDFALAIAEVRSSDARVLIVGAEGRHFSAGADVKAAAQCLGLADGAKCMATFAARMQKVWASVAGLEIPALAAVQGAALGGGLELALACDVRIAARSACLGLPEVRLGVLPAAGGTQRLTRLAGAGTASLLMLTGESVDAATALRLGIVDGVVEDDELGGHVDQLASSIASHPRLALKAIKRCIAKAADDDGFEAELTASLALHESQDAVDRIRMFAAAGSPTDA